MPDLIGDSEYEVLKIPIAKQPNSEPCDSKPAIDEEDDVENLSNLSASLDPSICSDEELTP